MKKEVKKGITRTNRNFALTFYKILLFVHIYKLFLLLYCFVTALDSCNFNRKFHIKKVAKSFVSDQNI